MKCTGSLCLSGVSVLISIIRTAFFFVVAVVVIIRHEAMESNYDNEEERASQAGILRVDARAAEELSRGQTDTVYVERIVSNPEH